MKTKMLVIASLGFFLLGNVLKDSLMFGLCKSTEPGCINHLTQMGNALFYGAGALTLIFVVLLFIPKAFSAWKRFAIWFIPLAALLFVFYPEPGSGDFFSPHAETVYRWVSGLYILISASIISFVRFQKK